METKIVVNRRDFMKTLGLVSATAILGGFDSALAMNTGKDITDGHTDFYARFTKPGIVVAAYDPDPESFDHAVTKRQLEILRTATDANGRNLEVIVLEAPSQIKDKYASDDFAAGYINFYVCNGAVIAPEFGDKKPDADAKHKLEQLFRNREIILLNIDGIAAGGGGIHCTTQQEPRV